MDPTSPSGPAAQTVDAAQGVAWWTEAWAMFMKNPGMWLLFGLAFMVGSFILHWIPLLGSLASALLTPVIIGGWMLAARKQQDGGTIAFEDLFSGFGPPLSSLLVIGAVLLVIELLMTFVVGVVGLGAILGVTGGAAMHSSGGMMAGLGAGLFALLLALLAAFAVSLLLWFAPALVVFEGVPPIDALQASVRASLRNIGPFVMFGLLSIGAMLLVAMTFGLGILLVFPLGMLAMYQSYRGVFGR